MGLHVCTFSAEHWVVPGVHATAHAPAVHTAGHSVWFCQVPVPSHIWLSLPLHRMAVGTHVPVQTFAVHTNGHAVAAPQLPVASQV